MPLNKSETVRCVKNIQKFKDDRLKGPKTVLRLINITKIKKF